MVHLHIAVVQCCNVSMPRVRHPYLRGKDQLRGMHVVVSLCDNDTYACNILIAGIIRLCCVTYRSNVLYPGKGVLRRVYTVTYPLCKRM